MHVEGQCALEPFSVYTRLTSSNEPRGQSSQPEKSDLPFQQFEEIYVWEIFLAAMSFWKKGRTYEPYNLVSKIVF